MHEKSIGPFTLRSHPVSVERQSGAIGHWLLHRDPLPRRIAGWTLLFHAGWDPIDPTMHYWGLGSCSPHHRKRMLGSL
jgi:hypothetical protein